MAFSIRDNTLRSPICCSPLRSQAGQGTIEYVLVLVVGVAIILGSLYQLNTAFKSWANNYFGEYLACLLETGELPNIGGSPGDGGVCEQLFKAFTIADGRPSNGTQQAQEEEKGGPGRGARERGGGGGGPVRYNSGGGLSFGRGSGTPPQRVGKKISGGTELSSNTDASGYGGGYTYYQRPVNKVQRTKLDNKFAFQDQRDRDVRRKVAATTKKSEEEARKAAIKLKPKSLKKTSEQTADSGFSIGNFIRIIIIAAIIIALVMFLGGQMLQISKSMD